MREILPSILLVACSQSPVGPAGKGPHEARGDMDDSGIARDSGTRATDTSVADTSGGDSSNGDTYGGDTAPGTDCPAPPSDLVEFTLPDGFGHPVAAMMLSGQVGTIALAPTSPYNSEQVTFGESAGGAYSPQPVTVEISINRCRGVIDTDTTDQCNVRSLNGAYNAITFFGHGYDIIDSHDAANARGYCWAPDADGPWYVNMRWTYTECAFDAATCGFMVQLNPGPY
jgi:hypothetical protein